MTVPLPMGAHWIRFPRFFGDAMMIHTAIAPLRAAGLPLVAWGPGWVVDLFAGSAEYCAAVPDPDSSASRLSTAGPTTCCSAASAPTAALPRGHRPASLINFPKSHRPMLAAFLARVPLRLGCGDGGASLFYTHSVAFYKQDTAFVDRYASVVARAFPDLAPGPFRPYRPRTEAMETVAARRADLGHPGRVRPHPAPAFGAPGPQGAGGAPGGPGLPGMHDLRVPGPGPALHDGAARRLPLEGTAGGDGNCIKLAKVG